VHLGPTLVAIMHPNTWKGWLLNDTLLSGRDTNVTTLPEGPFPHLASTLMSTTMSIA
jgi:hypothetical protein